MQKRIAAWYRKSRRDLQWRTTTDPYEIIISEVMLQQTQVARVKEKLPAFLKQFPDFRALARAKRSDVLRAWQGMGYNNRAIRLHEMARIVVEQHGGALPCDIDALLALPGIGKYTAHAVTCFAFLKRVPVVDVNIMRVFSRIYHRMPEHAASRPIDEIWERASEALPRNAYDWNQALMDLGATICTARSPKCGACPVSDLCASRPILARVTTIAPSPKQIAKLNEPTFAGKPRRIWRGKIVDTLRRLEPGEAMSIHRLGKSVKHDFGAHDMPWFREIVQYLANDGLVHLRKYRDDYHASLVD